MGRQMFLDRFWIKFESISMYFGLVSFGYVSILPGSGMTFLYFEAELFQIERPTLGIQGPRTIRNFISEEAGPIFCDLENHFEEAGPIFCDARNYF